MKKFKMNEVIKDYKYDAINKASGNVFAEIVYNDLLGDFSIDFVVIEASIEQVEFVLDCISKIKESE